MMSMQILKHVALHLNLMFTMFRSSWSSFGLEIWNQSLRDLFPLLTVLHIACHSIFKCIYVSAQLVANQLRFVRKLSFLFQYLLVYFVFPSLSLIVQLIKPKIMDDRFISIWHVLATKSLSTLQGNLCWFSVDFRSKCTVFLLSFL